MSTTLIALNPRPKGAVTHAPAGGKESSMATKKKAKKSGTRKANPRKSPRRRKNPAPVARRRRRNPLVAKARRPMRRKKNPASPDAMNLVKAAGGGLPGAAAGWAHATGMLGDKPAAALGGLLALGGAALALSGQPALGAAMVGSGVTVGAYAMAKMREAPVAAAPVSGLLGTDGAVEGDVFFQPSTGRLQSVKALPGPAPRGTLGAAVLRSTPLAQPAM